MLLNLSRTIAHDADSKPWFFDEGLTLGIGIILKFGPGKYLFDYTYSDFGLLGSPQKISIGLNF